MKKQLLLILVVLLSSGMSNVVFSQEYNPLRESRSLKANPYHASKRAPKTNETDFAEAALKTIKARKSLSNALVSSDQYCTTENIHTLADGVHEYFQEQIKELEGDNYKVYYNQVDANGAWLDSLGKGSLVVEADSFYYAYHEKMNGKFKLTYSVRGFIDNAGIYQDVKMESFEEYAYTYTSYEDGATHTVVGKNTEVNKYGYDEQGNYTGRYDYFTQDDYTDNGQPLHWGMGWTSLPAGHWVEYAYGGNRNWIEVEKNSLTREAGKLTETVLISVDGTWQASERSIITYTTFNKEQERLWQTWSTATDGWKDREKTVHNYNLETELDTLTEYYNSDDAETLVLNAKWRHKYENGKEVLLLKFGRTWWDAEHPNNLVPYEKYTYSYYPDGRLQEWLFEQYDRGTLVNTQKTTYTYPLATSDFYRSYNVEVLQRDNSWEPIHTTVYGFDDEERMVKYESINYADGVEAVFSKSKWIYETCRVLSAPSPEVISDQFQVYPNPATDKANVAFNLEQPGKATILVYNSLGRTVLHTSQHYASAGRKNEALDVTSLPSGVYILIMKTDDGASHVTRIVKK